MSVNFLSLPVEKLPKLTICLEYVMIKIKQKPIQLQKKKINGLQL